jgi:hypothetical protein
MRIQVAVEVDNMAQMEIPGTEEGVHLTQPFEDRWNPAG